LSSNLATQRFAIVDIKPKHDNQAILEDLKQQQQKLTLACYAAGVWGIAGIGFFPPLVAVAVPPLTILLGKLQTISQQILLMARLIEAFEEEGIEIFPRLDPPGDLLQIDFFLRFPDKKFIVLRIGSQGDSKISYNEKTETLQIRRHSGLKPWEPDPLSILGRQQIWIKEERRDLLGSSRGSRKPIAKILVLWGDTKLNDHNEHLYSTMAGYRALWIQKFGFTCITEEKDAIDTIRAYLARERQK
jgi:hypothetical protein